MEDDSELELAIDACADRLEFLNDNYSSLATETTRNGVALWRQYRERRYAKAATPVETETRERSSIDLKSIIIDLLQQNSLEDVLDLLAAEYSTEMNITEMVKLIGRQEYLIALKRELNELLSNAISFEQISTLWNDLGRPAPGGDSWNSGSVSLLSGG